jgi:hypothetical protein
MVDLLTLQTIHRLFSSGTTEYEDELTEFEYFPACPDSFIEWYLLLSSGVCLVIDAISLCIAFLKYYEIEEWQDSYTFLVDLQFLPACAECRPILYVCSNRGNKSDIQVTFDQFVTKNKTWMLVPAPSFDVDLWCSFGHAGVFMWWVRRYREIGEVSTRDSA